MCVTARESEGENRGASDGRGGGGRGREGGVADGASQPATPGHPERVGWKLQGEEVAEEKESGRGEERRGRGEWRE